jgi:aspartyl/asparaginyl beta-hydroxylase (cupin superfamily)
MQLSNAEAERLVRDGVGALRQGNAAAAQQAFGRVAASGRANAQVWLLLAHAARQSGDNTAEDEALEALLKADPASIRGLIMKGDRLAGTGDARAATSFYRRAVGLAAGAGELPADLRAEVERAERAMRDAESAFRAHLNAELASRGVAAPAGRFRQSLEIMTGARQVFFQQPTEYFFPELPHIQFYDPALFPWAGALETQADAIRAECAALLERRELFRPYLVTAADRPRSDVHGLADNPDWSSFYLWEHGAPVEENAALCARTVAALEKVPLARISVRAPVVMFSWLKPGARIPPHTGAMNARLICHLPLIVPPGCGFRVGNEVREWEVGKLLVFDDTIEHEAWNDSGEDRVVLIFDVWRPELSEEERRSVAALFEAVDAFPGAAR